ncbi:hypothetical protein NUW58_g1228 [Xylaria curta]|uniref:Uncharacterized protein n=1 Tax=Xylaria curta TaxID=42375 RepID=A0ACC1PPG2_9PEZI|nr:hypothetical protein NUW58_g1228 [Xylaria curta]
MISTQKNGEHDVEKGDVGGHPTANRAIDQDIERVDFGEFFCIHTCALSANEDWNKRGASIRSTSYSESLCVASIDSRDDNITTPWIPKGIRTETVHSASPRGASPNRRIINSCTPMRGPLEPLRDGEQSPQRMETTQIDGPSRTITFKNRVGNTALAELRDHPGLWAIKHHKNNFIRKIKKTPTWNSTLYDLWKQVRGTSSRNIGSDEGWERPDEDSDLLVSLAELQRMRLRKLQCKLVTHIAHMKTTGEESGTWENDLETYVKAIQDYDYMTSRCKLPSDPFYVTGERNIDSYVLHSLLGDAAKEIAGESVPVGAAWGSTPEPIGGTRNDTTAKSESYERRRRVAIAAVAGSFLVGPMWLMVLHNTLYTCLVSTTIFVTVFGLILALFLDSPKEVMSGTAAYAAVLVVFVGLAMAASPPKMPDVLARRASGGVGTIEIQAFIKLAAALENAEEAGAFD